MNKTYEDVIKLIKENAAYYKTHIPDLTAYGAFHGLIEVLDALEESDEKHKGWCGGDDCCSCKPMPALEPITQEEYFQRLAHHLPETQREEAIYRMTKAALDGVEDIGLWTGDEPADISDLVGNCPKRREELAQENPEAKYFASGLVPLSKYKSK